MTTRRRPAPNQRSLFPDCKAVEIVWPFESWLRASGRGWPHPLRSAREGTVGQGPTVRLDQAARDTSPMSTGHLSCEHRLDRSIDDQESVDLPPEKVPSMYVLIFIGILIVLGIIGAVLDPVIKEHERARIANLQRNLSPGRVVCPVCKGTRRIWNGGGGNPNPYTRAPSGRNERCHHCRVTAA